MKKIYLFIPLCCLLISCATTNRIEEKSTTNTITKNTSINKLPVDTDTKKYLEYENGYFEISYIPYLYRLENDHSINSNNFYSNPISISYKTYDPKLQNTIKREGNYFSINDKTLKIDFTPDNKYVAFAKNVSNLLEVLKDGDATIHITIGDDIHTDAIIHQITIPLSPSDTADNLIEKIGFPDAKKDYSIKWPDKKTIDGIFYDTTISIKDYYVTHYYYKKYPYLCLSRGISTLFRCGVCRQWNEYVK